MRVTIERSGFFDEGGACANVIPHDDFKILNFPSSESEMLIFITVLIKN